MQLLTALLTVKSGLVTASSHLKFRDSDSEELCEKRTWKPGSAFQKFQLCCVLTTKQYFWGLIYSYVCISMFIIHSGIPYKFSNYTRLVILYRLLSTMANNNTQLVHRPYTDSYSQACLLWTKSRPLNVKIFLYPGSWILS